MTDQDRRPNFNLAPLEQIDPAALIPPSGQVAPLDELMLGFAAFFNDLQGILVLGGLLRDKVAEDSDELTSDHGQYHGLMLQLGKLMVGATYEFLELVDHYSEVLESPEFKSYLSNQPDKLKEIWLDVLAIATQKKKGKVRRSEVANALSKIRNKGSTFHYTDTKTLVSGYRRAFFRGAAATQNPHAFASLGDTLETTRFYFVDAAVEQATNQLAGDAAQFNEEYGQAWKSAWVLAWRVLAEHCRRAMEKGNID